MKHTSPKNTLFGKLRDGIAVAAIVVMMAILLRSAVLAAGDRNRVCVNNAFAITQALSAYVTDYDERFPYFMGNAAAVQQYLTPYFPVNAPVSAVFLCPATRNTPYVFNGDLAGKTLTETGDPAKTPVVQDGKPHPDGKLTVGFADRHVERGGQVQPPLPDPTRTCVQFAQQINRGLLMYVQDYDETLPVFSNDAEIKSALLPYVRVPENFQCPETFAFYHWNMAISGHVLAEYATPFTVETFRDAVLHKDKTVTKGFLDGHVKRGPP